MTVFSYFINSTIKLSQTIEKMLILITSFYFLLINNTIKHLHKLWKEDYLSNKQAS